VHAGIGSPGDNERNGLAAKQHAERAFDLTLDASPPRLGGPTGKPAPVVFENELYAQTSSRSTISVASERRGPSFRIRV